MQLVQASKFIIFMYSTYFNIPTEIRVLLYTQSMHAENAEKRRRTNVMISSIAIVFFVSWLPLNIFDLLMKIDSKVTNFRGRYAFIYNGKTMHNEIKFTFFVSFKDIEGCDC